MNIFFLHPTDLTLMIFSVIFFGRFDFFFSFWETGRDVRYLAPCSWSLQAIFDRCMAHFSVIHFNDWFSHWIRLLQVKSDQHSDFIRFSSTKCSIPILVFVKKFWQLHQTKNLGIQFVLLSSSASVKCRVRLFFKTLKVNL